MTKETTKASNKKLKKKAKEILKDFIKHINFALFKSFARSEKCKAKLSNWIMSSRDIYSMRMALKLELKPSNSSYKLLIRRKKDAL